MDRTEVAVEHYGRHGASGRTEVFFKDRAWLVGRGGSGWQDETASRLTERNSEHATALAWRANPACGL